MKLIGPRYSAFVARVRLALALKGLPCEETGAPAGGLRGKAFLALNPLGRVPVLVLDDGVAIAESETILAFLDEAYPNPPLLPSDWRARVRTRTIVRLVDNYLTPAIECLYPFRGAERFDPTLLGYAMAETKTVLETFAPYVDAGQFPVFSAVGLADCVLFPALYLVKLVTTQLGVEDVFVGSEALVRYFEAAKADPIFGAIYVETVADLGDPELIAKLDPGLSLIRQSPVSNQRPVRAGQVADDRHPLP
jgi:glutathione S-transferase